MRQCAMEGLPHRAPSDYDRGYELFLPSFSAAAWFHHRFGGQHAGSVADAVA